MVYLRGAPTTQCQSLVDEGSRYRRTFETLGGLDYQHETLRNQDREVLQGSREAQGFSENNADTKSCTYTRLLEFFQYSSFTI